MMVELKPRSNKGKQRINAHGSLWDVVREKSRVGFSPVPGRWLFLRSCHDGDLRWVHTTHDDDFTVVFMEVS